MPPGPLRVASSGALPLLARLYGASEGDLAALAGQLTGAYLLRDGQGEPLGVVGLRSTPRHGSEVMGGAFPGARQQEAAAALLRAALAQQPHLYAYAEAHLLPEAALQAAGLRRAGAYTQMTGDLPLEVPQVPRGYRILPLADVPSREVRRAAQETYSHRLGHTHVPDEVADPNYGGSDDTLSRLALAGDGTPAGLCRVWMSGEEVSLGTPGVHPSARGTGLRRALLLAACRAAGRAGATRAVLDAWGDTDEERGEDEALGFVVRRLTPIYAAP